jgi:hypothetical protein
VLLTRATQNKRTGKGPDMDLPVTTFRRPNQQGCLAVPRKEKKQQMIFPEFRISRHLQVAKGRGCMEVVRT